jgi:hypothetical protein
MKKILLVLASASWLSVSGCGSKKEDPTPAPNPAPTLVGTWNLVSQQTTTTPTSGSAVTTTQAYPIGKYTLTFTTTTFQAYVDNVAQGVGGDYLITGTNYILKNGALTRTAQITEFTNARFVTVETSTNGTATTVVTQVLTR